MLTHHAAMLTPLEVEEGRQGTGRVLSNSLTRPFMGSGLSISTKGTLFLSRVTITKEGELVA